MVNKFSEYEAKKQELNCGVNTIPLIKYMENILGYEKTKIIVESLGLPLTFLMNKRNWVSYKFYTTLLEKLVEATGDEKAPFKIAFNMGKPQSIFNDLQYAGYAALFLGDPKNMYRLTFSKNYYTTYQKTLDFKIQELKNNYLKVKLLFKDGYNLDKNNLEVIKGYMAFGTVSCGLAPAEVNYFDIKNENGKASCVYEVRWKQQKNNFKIFSIMGFILCLIIELFFLKSFLSIKDILLSLSFYIIIILFTQCLILLKKIRFTQFFNYEKNNSVLESMEKIEKDYNEILDTKQKLEERNRYLSIINEVNKTITEAFYFNLLIDKVMKILFENFKFKKSAYFEYNLKKNRYTAMYYNEHDHENNENSNYHIIASQKLYISKNEYENIKKLGYIFTLKQLKIKKIFNIKNIKKLVELDNANDIFFLPITISDFYSGFFLFLNDKKIDISKDIMFTLFENISDLIKIGYHKISSRYVIENILSSIPSNVIIFNKDNYNIKYANNQFIATFLNDITNFQENIIGTNLFSLLQLDNQTKDNINKYIMSMSENKSEAFEVNLGAKVFEYYVFPIPQYREEEKLVGLILTDVTEAKSFQQKLIINEKLIALGKVASGIAHEINNPLYAVLANAEEIADSNDVSDQIKKYAQEMIDHVMNVSNIIKDLSAYSKTLRKEKSDEVDLNSIIEESLKLVRYSSNFLEIEIDKNLVTLPVMNATKGELQQVFINLFNNAIQAMNGKGILNISSEYIDNMIIIKIADTGPGIKDEVLPHIFDLYFTTKAPGEGTGQGLHIVKKIINSYNGTIDVETKLGIGTTFTIKFKIK